MSDEPGGENPNLTSESSSLRPQGAPHADSIELPGSNGLTRRLDVPPSEPRPSEPGVLNTDRPAFNKHPLANVPVQVQLLPAFPKIIAIIEFTRLFRWTVVAIAMAYGLQILTDGTVAIVTSEKSWWQAILLATVPPTSLVGTVALLLKKRFEKRIEKIVSHNRSLEERLDPNRESSAADHGKEQSP